MKRGFFSRWAGVVSLALALLVLSSSAQSQSFYLSSESYLLYFERDVPGDTLKFVPLYEFVSGDVEGLGDRPVSFHFNAWGRLDLGDDSGEDGTAGDLGSAYLRYVHPEGNVEAKLGRFFLTEGAAADTIDGFYFTGRSIYDAGVSLFAGLPVESTITGVKTGDFLTGARFFYEKSGLLEAGVSYVFESGDFRDGDRGDIGVDLWLRPYQVLEFMGQAVYSTATSSFASQDYLIKINPRDSVEIGLSYEDYRYRGYFHSSLNPAFASPALDTSDEVQIFGARVGARLVENLNLSIAVEAINHDSGKEGDADRYEVSGEYRFGESGDFAGCRVAFVDADESENEYSELRGYGSFGVRDVKITLDAIYQRLKEAINGEKNSYQVVAGASYEPLENLSVYANLTYTKSPRFEEDYAFLARVTYRFDWSRGGDEE